MPTEQASELGVVKLYLLTTTASAYFANLGFRAVTRARIPEQLERSREFQGACPASASAMMMKISPPQTAKARL